MMIDNLVVGGSWIVSIKGFRKSFVLIIFEGV